MPTPRLHEVTKRWDRDEQRWLARFREALAAEYSEVVSKAVVFGSKARGEAREESDIDVMVVVKDEAADAQDPIADMATELVYSAECWTAVPCVLTRTESEWTYGLALESPFHENVEREGISLL